MRCKIAIDSALEVGLPEAIIPLSDTVIELALSPKSKAAVKAAERATEIVTNQPLEVLDYLKLVRVNVNEEDGYPYEMPEIWNKLQYLPEPIKDMKFYIPEDSSQFEKVMNDSYRKLEQIKRSSNMREVKKKK